MKKELKRHIASLLSTGHRHYEMSKMMQCAYCGEKFKKAEREFNRLKKEHSKDFFYKEPIEEKPDKEMAEMGERIADRMKHDKAYNEHIRKLAFGTPKEKREETKKFISDYYAKRGESSRIIIS